MCIPFLITLFIALCSFDISHDQMNWRDEGSYGVFFLFLLDLYHIYHATKMGSAAGSRDNVREAFTCFFLFLFPTIYCAFFPHFLYSYLCLLSLSAHTLLIVYKSRRELWRSKGVYMLCFFVLSKSWGD